MQEINWGNFRAKFNGKEQQSFELLSYLLFCDEYNKKSGIFRYKNQAGIEAEPILVDGEWVGFQAKFYDTKIRDNKGELIGSITKAKKKNPQLKRILFYLNQEFPESSDTDTKDPKYKTDIEATARREGIEIEWRVPSHFEAQLALDKNRIKAEYFFSLRPGVVDFIEELCQSTERIFTPIHSKIEFNGKEIKIDRSHSLNELKTALEQLPLVIVSGEGGVGKTAVVKDLYDQIKEESPFFIFKATEFNVAHINELFHAYGMLTLSNFINEHKEVDDKYVVIDSAEKLSDLEDYEAFQEFLSALLNAKWKIIFTTRHSYLENLKVHFLEVYRLPFKLQNIERLNVRDVQELSEKYSFPLPKNDRLLELLTNPFYLNEYLQHYESVKSTATSSDFKNILWNKVIRKSYYRNNTHLRREACFLNIAQKRANEGRFFVEARDCDDDILYLLEADEIIKHDSSTGGYFITHDIYEEWALDRIIERTYLNAEDYKDFFNLLGSSLPIRRAFRAWLSEKLFSISNGVKILIENVINADEIEQFWKDEVLVSVLLSDYSEAFFQLFEAKLLENDQKLLTRLVFLLRIACKELDESLLQLLGIQNIQGNALQTLFTKPRGSGWNCTIRFIHKHVEAFGLQNIRIILPLLDDWINKNKEGETTKKASQIGLFYYKEIIENGGFGYSSRDDGKEQLFSVILQGASEIKGELANIFEEVIREKQINHSDKHYALIKTILTSITVSFEVAKNLPEKVLSLADLFWFQTYESEYGYSGIDVEEYFCISANHFEYFPSSAFQTPIFHLLRFFPKGTIDFILAFTNKTVECYAKSDLDGQIEEVTVFVDETRVIQQYISNRLWNMYRGTQVSTCLLESIHMALEKWLLEYANTASQEELELVCKYLISNSKSASITAVVASVVLANTQKLFNIAAILFQTKEFFFYDTTRMSLDQNAKSQYSIGYGLNGDSKLHQDERIKTCDDPHRRLSLENIAFSYQFFRSAAESAEEAERKQRVLWDIFDTYYQKLPNNDKETASDKTWRLYLARMDGRKMQTEIEEKDGGILVKFNPEIEPELKKYSEDSLQKSSEPMRHIPLKLWSSYRFKKEEDKYKQYQQYENDPQLALAETKEIIEELKSAAEEDFSLFNRHIPAYTCSVLVRDFFDKLSLEDKEFCKEAILEFASIPLRFEQYHYQLSDGTEPSIMSLPELLKDFSQGRDEIKFLLFLLLLNPWREIVTFAIRSILHSLWEISFKDAQSIFVGYLLLKQKYDNLKAEIREENYKNDVYERSEEQAIERFDEQYEKELESIVSNKTAYEDVKNLEQLDLEILNTAFELLPLRTKNVEHKKFLSIIFPVFSKKLFLDIDKVDYDLKHRFLVKLAYFILASPKEEIKLHLKSFVDNFNNSENVADFFQEFIIAEDTLNQYEEFWMVWDTFYEKIVEISKKSGTYYYSKGIIRNYLLAWPYWREDAKEWHSLKEREKRFFSKVANDMGHCPTVLYSLSKMLNSIGSNFLEEGISWISVILQRNEKLVTEDLETNTVYYVENLVRRYFLRNRQKIKTTLQIKKQVIVILNFLIERGSVTGYLLREDIL